MATTTCLHQGKWVIATLCLLFFFASAVHGQSSIDSVIKKTDAQKWVAAIDKKASSLEEKLITRSNKTLNRLQRQEEKIYRRQLRGKDSVAANTALKDIKAKYDGMRAKLATSAKAGAGMPYIPKLDSLSTALKFLDQNGASSKVKEALAKATALKESFGQAEEIQQFIKSRREQLKAQLEKLGMLKQLRKFNKEVYYYSAQVKEYKELLNDSKKMEKKSLELLSKTKLFKDFFRKNSQLASLFRLPGDAGDPFSQASLAGLQTRAQVNNLVQQQVAAGGPGAAQQVSQNIQGAQAQLAQLKEKVLKAGGNGSGDEFPDFKPNNQKTKGFWKRLELGTNVQTQKATNFFPVTSDIGLSLGYKLNDKGIIGIGASYKMGWGNGWRDLTISHQGVGLRSYVDVKLKGSFWISGGYEQNYRAGFNSITQLRDMNAWQQSGLIGISKVVSLKTKFFKKTKLQLLWDFLSYEQVPQTQPVSFRIGYTF